MRFSSTVSTCRKSTARIPAAWACRNCRQVGPVRRGAGSMPAACRICHTVDGATVTPSLVSSPWIRPYPTAGLPRQANGKAGDAPDCRGRPGLRRLLVSYLPAASLRCQASSVTGVTGKTSLQHLRGMSRASAESQARSAGSYRTRATCLAQQRVLVAQNQQLRVLGQVTAKLHGQQTRHGTDDQINEGEDHPW